LDFVRLQGTWVAARRTGLSVTADLHNGWCTFMCMRTNIDIDDDVLREAQRLVGTRTKRDTVNLALRELVARHRQIGILDLRGKVHWDGDLAESRRGRS
jgi:Arc/MetJ family transcription regulator